MRWTVAIETLNLRWATHAAAGIGSETDVEPRVGCGTSATTGGTGGGILVAIATGVECLVVVNPIGRCGLTVGELRGDHLADDDGSRVDQVLDGRRSCVGRRVQPVPSSVSVGRSQALDICGSCQSLLNDQSACNAKIFPYRRCL